MTPGRFNKVLACIRRLASGCTDAAHSDRHLLERFANQRDQDAFALLVQRHGSLVLSVCRRILNHEQDAEDAFQAVFLVLARKADSVGWHNDIGNWLYGVACRIARKARGHLRRDARSGPVPEIAAPASEQRDWQEIRPILDEEVGRLPEKYRAPIVLCYLQGKTYGEAAQLLGWAEGTVSGRLARARALLRTRLVRRGVAPSAALLMALPSGSAEAALSASLVHAATRAAAAFAWGSEALNNGPAVALANEVLQSMMLTKWKLGAVVLLALAATGTTAMVLAQRQRFKNQPEAAPLQAKAPPAAKTDMPPRPPLKKEWQGRWDADPFAGTTAIEVEHRADDGPGRTDVIEDPKTVAALMKRLVIQGFQNNIAQGNIPATNLTFRKKDGKSFAVTLDSQGTFQCFLGEIHVDPAFLAALNQQLAGTDGQPTDLTRFLPAAPRNKPAPPPPQTLDMLQDGFQSFRVRSYGSSKTPSWEGTITDRKALEELAKSLTVIERQAKQTLPTRAEFTAIPNVKTKREAIFGYVLDREHLFVPDIGTLTIKPSFVQTLNRHLSQLHGCTVDILGDRKPTEEQLKRERAFREQFKGARSLRCIEKGKQDIVVDGREEVEKSLEALRWVETPVRKCKAEATNAVIEVAPARGEKIRVIFLRLKESVEVQPLSADLVEVAGFGQMWLDANWKLSFRFLAERREMEAREQRQLETMRLVGADLPAFLKQVVSLVVTYQEMDEQLLEFLNADTSRPVLEAMQVEKVEELSWTPQRWQQEMSKLQEQGSGTIELNPGVGFSLPLIFAGEKELLIPRYGRVRLKADITPKVRQALRNNPDKARGLKLLPHGPE